MICHPFNVILSNCQNVFKSLIRKSPLLAPPSAGRQNKVRADIFPRFFGGFSIRKGRFGIGRRLDGGNRRPLLMFIRRSVSVGGKIGSDIFKCCQPITKWAVFQQRPPADFPFKLEFFIFCPAECGTGQKRAFSDSRIKGGKP